MTLEEAKAIVKAEVEQAKAKATDPQYAHAYAVGYLESWMASVIQRASVDPKYLNTLRK